jgi:hypothetical protein
MSTTCLHAAFSADDQAVLVQAAFACRFCLGAPDRIAIERDDEGGLALSTCGTCGELSDVWLSVEQCELVMPYRPA